MANKERVQLLVDALRSGEFEQGKSWLRRGNKYCCLGVACEVAIRNGLELIEESFQDFDSTQYSDGRSASAKVLPISVMEWYGFENQNPDIRDVNLVYNGHISSAANLNDMGAPFESIATGFEQMYLNE